MPKGKKKGKFEHRRTEQPYSSDEDAGIDMTIDNCSETSAQSDLKSNHDDAAFDHGASGSGFGIRSLSCFGNLTARPKSGANMIVSTSSVTFNGIDTRDKRRSDEENVLLEQCDLNDSEDDVLYAQNVYLTLDTPYPNPESEWDTASDLDGRDSNDEVEVPHRGHPSVYRETKKDDNDDESPSRIHTDTIRNSSENEAQEKLEEKVLELIDALSARAAAARAAALVALRGALQRRHLAGVLAAHRATLADHVARAVRRGRDAERRAAAALAPILALQIGDEGTEEYMREVRPALVAGATDKSSSLDTRTECCSSLAVLCYLLEEDMTEILDILRMYETIFSGSYLKGDGSVKVSGAVVEEGGWHAGALDGWALLLGALEPRHARALLQHQPPGVARLADLLEACSLEVRMAAGGALAIVHERVTEGEEDMAWGGAGQGQEQLVLERLGQLARDSHKYRAKRDRKLQRATFRDILKYFEEGEVPPLRVRVGTEAVECESWSSRCAYGALAAVLGAGLRPLLAHCAALRAALGLPTALPLAMPAHKLNKLQRHLQNTAACKARTVARNKNRDKRSAALAL